MIVIIVNSNNFIVKSIKERFTLSVIMCGTYPSRLYIIGTFNTEGVAIDAKKSIPFSRLHVGHCKKKKKT